MSKPIIQPISLSISYLKPNMIDYMKAEVLEIKDFDVGEIKKRIPTKFSEKRKKAIEMVLDSKEFIDMQPQNQFNFMFIDRLCNGILEIQIKKNNWPKEFHILTINLDVLENYID